MRGRAGKMENSLKDCLKRSKFKGLQAYNICKLPKLNFMFQLNSNLNSFNFSHSEIACI